ncbi:hypothetical protein BDV11DRAFT_198292 [Aspergillus similis]
MDPSAIKIKDLIPLYLADQILLSSAIQSATQSSTSSLLSAVLKESRSLPRQIDTDPTTPTPDLPSPAQERLLHFVRDVQRNLGQESKVGYDALRAAMDMDGGLLGYKLGLGHNGRGSGYREQRVMGPLIDIDVDTRWNINGTESTNGEVEDVFTPEDTSSLATVPASGSGSTRQRRRSSVSGAQKHLYNLLSFVSFLTKESLLLQAGAGERVAVEMIVETLEHPDPESALKGHEPWFGRARRSGSGFGSDVGSRSGGRASEMTVTAISVWLIIMGEELHARAQSQASVRNAKSKGKSASLIDLDDGSGSEDGEEGEGTWPQLSEIVIREWETWTTRLHFLSLRQDLDIQAREQAAEAAAVMRRVYY